MALFDLGDYGGALVSDLFGDDVFFDDPAKFWALQNKAIADLRAIHAFVSQDSPRAADAVFPETDPCKAAQWSFVDRQLPMHHVRPTFLFK